MAIRIEKEERDVEKSYPTKDFVAKLRRLADCLEQGDRSGSSGGGAGLRSCRRCLEHRERAGG